MEMRAGQGLLKEEMLSKMETNEERMDAKIDTNQEKVEARIEANSEKFEVLQGALVSQVDIHQEKMEVTIHSIRSELEEIIKHWVEDVLSCVDQKMQGLHKELAKKSNEIQVGLQATKASINTWTGSLKGDKWT
jgi:hypothetical protein